MNRDRSGFAPIGIALIVAACIIVIGGAFYYFHLKQTPALPSVQQPQPPVASSTSLTASSTSTSNLSSTLPITSYRSYLLPSSGPVGTVVTIHASGFSSAGNQVLLDGMVNGSLDNLSSTDGKTLIFVVPSSLGPNCKPDQACPMYEMLVTPRSYTVSVVSNGITENIGMFTVTGGGESNRCYKVDPASKED